MIDPPTAACPGPGAAATDQDMPLHVGRYRIVQQLGEGGFGAVYEAEQSHPVKRRVALKLIKLGMDTREVIARFEAERQALALMEHPHIARVLDAGATESGRPYFVMELVSGEAISSYCDREQLSITERLQLFDQVCQAVQHAHTKGIIHRDLKPSNVLVSNQDALPFAKVIDFGIAKATHGHLDRATLLTAQQQMIGTPLYMSPEQAEGSADIDTRTDIYALGVLLYELLTGTTPFAWNTLRNAGYAEVQRIIREVDPPRPSVRLAESATTLSGAAARCRAEPRQLTRILRGELDWIAMKAIEKERQRRYETANALALDVRRYLAGQPVLAAPPSRSYRLRKFIQRHKGGVVAGTIVAAALIVGIIGFAWQARIAQRRATQLELVSRFQAEMLGQVDPTEAGRLLSEDVQGKFAAAIAKSAGTERSRAARIADFSQQWQQVNATDAARELIDRTILKPAVAAIDAQFKEQPLVDATLRQVLADRYVDMGLYDAALPLQARALEIRRQLLGDAHPDTLSAISGMGTQLQLQGELEEAEPYFREALATRERVLGAKHADTLTTLTKLGEHLERRGKYDDAESHLRRAVQGSREVLGEDHPDTLTAIKSLGVLLFLHGKLDEAEAYDREALDKRRRILGADHPDTLDSMNILGEVLLEQGKLEETEPYYREVLDRRRRVLGEEHPHTLFSINNMGYLLRAQGRLADAEPYFREALEKGRRVHGDSHPETLTSLNNMAALLQGQGRLNEAEPYYREALLKRRVVLGEEHPSTVLSTNNLGFVLHALGKLIEAEPYYREALDKNRRLLGDTHPSTLVSINNLGSLMQAQGRFAEAVALLAPAEPATRAAFTGSNGFRVGRLLMNLGKARTGLGEFAASELHLREAQTLLEETPGPLPKDRLDSIQALIDLYNSWNAREPTKDRANKQIEWQRKLDRLNADASK